MSYPQPDSDQYAIRGYDFFRLTTGLTSPGDIYESQQSGHAFALGPDSDVANVNVAYFDDQVPTFQNQVTIGPPRSMVGRLDARNESSYTPANRPGRLLFWPADIYDPSFKPNLFAPDQDTLTFVTPILDVIEYFQPQPSLVVERNDKTYRFQELPAPVRFSYLVIPFWGRKYASVRFFNQTAADVILAVIGVSYFINPNFQALQTELDGFVVGAGVQKESIVKASADGVFDALMIQVESNLPGPTPLWITVSDKFA